MSLNLQGGIGRVTALGVSLEAAAAIVDELVSLIDAAEQLYADLRGTEKFAAVQAALRNVVSDLGLSDRFDAIWKALGPFVSLVVTIWNLRGLWPHKQQQASG